MRVPRGEVHSLLGHWREGCDLSVAAVSSGDKGGQAVVVVVRTLALVVVRRVFGLVGLGSAPVVKVIEIAVLRHRLMVLRRQVAGPR